MTKRFVFEEMGYPTKCPIKEIIAAIRDRGVKKCVVCSEPDMVRAGITRRMTGILDEAGVKYVLCACGSEDDVPRGFDADSLIMIRRIEGNRSEIKMTALSANADSEAVEAVVRKEKETEKAFDLGDVPFMDAVADILMTIPGSITNLLTARREALAGAEA